LKGKGKKLHELFMQKRLAPSEENLPHAEIHSLLQFRLNGFTRQKIKGVHTGAAAVKTMAAGKITKSARNLKPEMVQML
jgi:hypothetical protein